MVAVGDKAPEFTLPASGGQTISLSEFKGKKVVLYFYPKDDTPGCTLEAKDFRDNIDAFEKCNTVILGASKDTPTKHDKFCTKYDLPFTLLSDEEGKLLDAYDVWKQKSMYGKTFMGIERTTILINENGVVSHVWPKVKVKGHVQEVLAAAQS